MESLVFTEKLVPEVYLESRDYKVFLRLLDMLYSDIKYDIDNWIKLYDPYETPIAFLPFLADFVGYDYSRKISITESRIIIDNFVQMLKNRGSKLSIQQMISVIVNARCATDPNNEEYKSAVQQLSHLEIYFDYNNGIIQIYFPRKIPYIRELIEYVRPIGCYVQIFEAEFPEPESDMAISTDFSYTKHKNYIPKVKAEGEKVVAEDSTYKVDQAEVNLSQIGKSDISDVNDNT